MAIRTPIRFLTFAALAALVLAASARSECTTQTLGTTAFHHCDGWEGLRELQSPQTAPFVPVRTAPLLPER